MKSILAIVFVLFLSHSFAVELDSDFDSVGRIFEDLQAEPGLNKLTPEQRNTFITERIDKKLANSSAARISWIAVAAAEPSQRYEIF